MSLCLLLMHARISRIIEVTRMASSSIRAQYHPQAIPALSDWRARGGGVLARILRGSSVVLK